MAWPRRRPDATQRNTGGTNLIVTGTVHSVTLGAERGSDYPFRTVADLRPDVDADSLVPTLDELRGEQMKPVDDLRPLREMLDAHGIGKLVGPSGVGKSTLALQLAAHGDRIANAWYFDLAQATVPLLMADTSFALDRLKDLAARNALVIIDNAHLDVVFENAAIERWRSRQTTGQLLFVTRRRTQRHALPAIDLTMNASALGAVLFRLGARAGLEIAPPPDEVTASWIASFPDLVSFTLAAQRQTTQLARGEWSLSVEDARRQVVERFMIGRSKSEITNLRRLAVLGRYEIGATLAALESDGIERLVNEGLVYRLGNYFVLEHPVSASMLSQVLSVSDEEVAAELIDEMPEIVNGLAALARGEGNTEQSMRLLRLFLPEGRLRAGFGQTAGPGAVLAICRSLTLAALISERDLDAQLAERAAEFLPRLRATDPLHALNSILTTKRHFPLTYERFSTTLEDPEWVADLTTWTETATPIHLAGVAGLLGTIGSELAAMVRQTAQTRFQGLFPYDDDERVQLNTHLAVCSTLVQGGLVLAEDFDAQHTGRAAEFLEQLRTMSPLHAVNALVMSRQLLPVTLPTLVGLLHERQWSAKLMAWAETADVVHVLDTAILLDSFGSELARTLREAVWRPGDGGRMSELTLGAHLTACRALVKAGFLSRRQADEQLAAAGPALLAQLQPMTPIQVLTVLAATQRHFPRTHALLEAILLTPEWSTKVAEWTAVASDIHISEYERVRHDFEPRPEAQFVTPRLTPRSRRRTYRGVDAGSR